MDHSFKMVAKTLKGLEAVLADELRQLGALNVEPGHRMVSFEGNLEILYKANLCCRTALRILKPFMTFEATDADQLYDRVKEFDWMSVMSVDKTFTIDSVVNSDTFTHSRFVTYRVKDGIVDWFRDHCNDRRPGVRVTDADVTINVHINGTEVTLSLDSSGESLHKRGYRTVQTEAPISEVLAAGIILMSGYRGQCAFLDPMCGSGTFAIEAAMIAANINPGVYRKHFAFENWKDFDQELFERLYNDDSHERPVEHPIIGCDISPMAAQIAEKNVRSAGVSKYVTILNKPLSKWDEAPASEGIIVTNPPYGERISAPDMEALYRLIGTTLKHVFAGWQAWIIGYDNEYFQKIGLAPSERVSLLNGGLECELRQYVLFEGNKKEFRAAGGKLKDADKAERRTAFGDRKPRFNKDAKDGGKPRFGKDKKDFKGGKDADRKPRFNKEAKDFKDTDRKPRFGVNNGKPRFDDRKPRFDKPAVDTAASSDNPLGRRRNPDALKMLENRKPSLPPQEGPLMRPRGWKKRSDK